MDDRNSSARITQRLLLERLAPGMEAPLQQVFRQAGDHFLTVTGRPEPDPDAAERELRSAERVEGREVYLVRLREGPDAGQPIGAAGWWAHHPEPGVALLGMLLIGRKWRRRGFAREALRAIADTLGEEGITELRTAVGAGDLARQEILLGFGFEPMDERKHISLDRGRVMIALYRMPIL